MLFSPCSTGAKTANNNYKLSKSTGTTSSSLLYVNKKYIFANSKGIYVKNSLKAKEKKITNKAAKAPILSDGKIIYYVANSGEYPEANKYTIYSVKINGQSLTKLKSGNGPANLITYYNGSFYIKNLQGDIVKIINESGTAVVTYTYDAWGKIINQTDSTIYNLANINLFKYRSYVYDYDTGLYYLQSRYYDPVTGRFINSDTNCESQTDTPLGTNMFAYCENNAVNRFDNFGKASSMSIKAITYAQKWCNKYNPQYYKYSHGDCANFVSQCLYAGGFSPMTSEWHSYQKKVTNWFGYTSYKYDVGAPWRLSDKLRTWICLKNIMSKIYIQA